TVGVCPLGEGRIKIQQRMGAPSRHPQEAAVSSEVLHGRLDISPWVIRTVERGYRIQFAHCPPHFNGVVSTFVKPERAHLLTQELQTLLDKGAIEFVPLPNRESGYYSRYFLFSKKDGELRPILDLHGLNCYLRTYKFKMLTIKMIVSQIQLGDWFVTIDFKDACFHIEILQQHRKFLRFAFGGEAYQYRVLPFSLALSPRTYTKCMDAALAPLQLRGIRILNYTDDWLILAQSQVHDRDVVLAHLISLELRLNAKKSVLSPAQRTTYLEGCMGLDHNADTAVSCTCQIHSKHPKEHQPRSESYSSLLSKSFKSHDSCIHGDTFGPPAHETISVVAQSQGISSKGQSPEANKDYVPGASYSFYVVQTLVSDFGSHSRSELSSQDANDRRFPHGLGCGLKWPSHLPDWHINCLKIMAVFRALKYFLQQLRGYHVLVRVDNTAVVSYINRQGRLRSCRLNRLAQQILLWAQDKFLSLRGIYIPGHMNMGADFLSGQAVTHGEWKLHPEVLKSGKDFMKQ
ncbi:hypothetical protein M9458_006165, partial [Cirrhinus mrigala]